MVIHIAIVVRISKPARLPSRLFAISKATVNFSGLGGVADFSLTASDAAGTPPSAPEPTPLLLLGSGLLGLGVLQRRKHA
jgi:hypothetical protein